VSRLVDVEDGLQRRVVALHVEGLVDGALGLREAEGVAPGDLAGDRVGPVPEFVPGNHLTDETDVERFFGRHRPPREEQILGSSCTEIPGMSVVFDAANGHQDDRIGEERIFRCDEQIHREEQVERPGDRLSLDCGDRRLGNVAPVPGVAKEFLRFPTVDLVKLEGAIRLEELHRVLVAGVEVVARGKMLSLGTHHDHADRVVLLGFQKAGV
jgi:hypothetical protein